MAMQANMYIDTFKAKRRYKFSYISKCMVLCSTDSH